VYALRSEIDEWRESRKPWKQWLNQQDAGRRPRLRLAVLPFENISRNPEEEYFADGLTEEMIAQLGRVNPETLGVIARTSVMRYKGTEKSAETIGRELHVDALLDGSVRRHGDQVRVTAQLIQVKDQSHLWSETYDRKVVDVLEIQTNVAEQIAKSLELQLVSKRTAKAVPNPAARDAYLRGRYFWNRRTVPEFFRAIEYFKRAVEIDPKYALAHAGLADTYSTLGWYGGWTGKEAWERAEAAARTALEVEPHLAEGHTSLAFGLHSFEWDWAESEREYRRALELDPNYVTGHQWYAFFLMAMGRMDEAEEQMKQALALDPLSLTLNSYYGWVLYFARKYDEAVEQVLRALDIEPDFLVAHFILGLVYSQKRMVREAIREYRIAQEIVGESVLVLTGLAHICGQAGKRREAKQYLDKLLRLKDQHVSPYQVAYAYAGCGMKDEAMEFLERAVEQRESWLPHLRVEPGLDGLRGEQRFQKIVSRLKFPESL
jgi:TolB-like protein/Tfp pilus assembly protein PilF